MTRLASLAVLATAVAGAAAAAPQPHVQVPSPTPLPLVAFEIDYAVANQQQNSGGVSIEDTLVSLGVTQVSATKCNLQVAWYDWDGTPAGLSGPFVVASGQTLEFTTSANVGNPLQYPPFELNIFRSPLASGAVPPFEGYGQILTDSRTCLKNLRADAEFAIQTINGSGPQPVLYKSINITRPTGLIGY